jgi:hypothetical protein
MAISIAWGIGEVALSDLYGCEKNVMEKEGNGQLIEMT